MTSRIRMCVGPYHEKEDLQRVFDEHIKTLSADGLLAVEFESCDAARRRLYFTCVVDDSKLAKNELEVVLGCIGLSEFNRTKFREKYFQLLGKDKCLCTEAHGACNGRRQCASWAIDDMDWEGKKLARIRTVEFDIKN